MLPHMYFGLHLSALFVDVLYKFAHTDGAFYLLDFLRYRKSRNKGIADTAIPFWQRVVV